PDLRRANVLRAEHSLRRNSPSSEPPPRVETPQTPGTAYLRDRRRGVSGTLLRPTAPSAASLPAAAITPRPAALSAAPGATSGSASPVAPAGRRSSAASPGSVSRRERVPRPAARCNPLGRGPAYL